MRSFKPMLLWLCLLSAGLLAGACASPQAAATPTPSIAASTSTAPPPSSTPVSPTATPLPQTAAPTATPLSTASPTRTPTATGVAPTSPPVPTPIPPRDAARSDVFLMLATYFDAISRKDYGAAAAYRVREGGGTPDPSIATTLAADYASASSVMPVVNPLVPYGAAAGSQYAPVPTLLVISQTDGSKRYVAGCVQARRANPFVFDPPQDTGWEVDRETFSPASSADANALATGCDTGGLPGPFNDRSSPVNLLAALYDAVNRKDYGRAYGYWEQPPSGMSLAQFASGYADTASVLVVVRPPLRYDGAAGSLYAAMPTLLVSTHTGGSKDAFVGCYVGRRTNPLVSGTDTGWRLYSGSLGAAPGNAANAALLATTACP